VLLNYKSQASFPVNLAKTKFGRMPNLPPPIEAYLSGHCLLEEGFFGLSRKDFRCKACNLAVNNCLVNRICEDSEHVRRRWMRNSKNGNSQLAVCTCRDLIGYSQEFHSKANFASLRNFELPVHQIHLSPLMWWNRVTVFKNSWVWKERVKFTEL
jgi:hypothetical protein